MGATCETRWQPIASAPKDGTKILLGRFVEKCPHRHNGHIDVDWWRTEKAKAGFVGFGHFNPRFWPATHWMPLPAPPHPLNEGER